MNVNTDNELNINWQSPHYYLALAQEPVVFWRVLRLKLGSSAGGDSLRFLVDFLKPTRVKCKSKILIFIYFIFICLFAFSRVIHAAHGGSQARGGIGAVATDLCRSHSNAGSEPHL